MSCESVINLRAEGYMHFSAVVATVYTWFHTGCSVGGHLFSIRGYVTKCGLFVVLLLLKNIP